MPRFIPITTIDYTVSAFKHLFENHKWYEYTWHEKKKKKKTMTGHHFKALT